MLIAQGGSNMEQNKEETTKVFGDLESTALYYMPGLRYMNFDKLFTSTDRMVMCNNVHLNKDGQLQVEWKDKLGVMRHMLSTKAVESAAKHGSEENPNETVLFVKTESGSIYCFRNAQLRKDFITEVVGLRKLNINVD
jgi:hypothetical protein